jgi:hypothetical protein
MRLLPTTTDVLSDIWNQANKLQVEFCGTIRKNGDHQTVKIEMKKNSTECVLSHLILTAPDIFATFHTHPFYNKPEYTVLLYDSSLARFNDISPPSPEDIMSFINFDFPQYVICRMGIWYYYPANTIWTTLNDNEIDALKKYVNFVISIFDVLLYRHGSDIAISFYLEALTEFPIATIINRNLTEFKYHNCSVPIEDVKDSYYIHINEEYEITDVIDSILIPLQPYVGQFLCDMDFYKLTL